MSGHTENIARAFSSHRFGEVYAHLAPHVRWVSVGGSTLDGRDAVTAACQQSLMELDEGTTEFTRFVCVAGSDVAAVDAIGRYVDSAGQVSTVSSCDFYEFDRAMLSTITSYAIELSSP